jgi:hypothetical protein
MQSYHLDIGQLESHTHSLSLSLSLYVFIYFEKHVYVQVVVIVAHIFPWFYVQERLKRPLWVGDRLPIQFS